LTNYGDLLSSESLLFAIVGVLLGIWYPELTAAKNVEIPDLLADAGPERAQVGEALRIKAWPLALAALSVALVFTPSSVLAIDHAIRALGRYQWSGLKKYDPVQTSIVLVTVLTYLLAIYLFSWVCNLRKVDKKLNP
jgi:hypothetical protein